MDKTLNKISFITTIFTIILLFQVFTFSLNSKYDILEQQKISLETSIKEVYIPQQTSFENTLKRITQYISETDQFLGIGGVSNTAPEYFDSVIFEEIMNAKETNDFELFLANTEHFFSERTTFFDTLPSIWPVEYSPRIRITSSFGERFSPFTGQLQMHSGIDLVSNWRAKILATAPGKILEYWPAPGTRINGVIYRGHPVFGGYIIIDHENGYRTHYAHLSEIYINSRSKIERGMVIGRMGNSGLSNGEHLHYGVEKFNEETKEWEFIDPINFLRGVKD